MFQCSVNDTSVIYIFVICGTNIYKLFPLFPMQVEASNILKGVSASLLTVNTEDSRDDQKLKDAADYLFNAVSNVLKASVGTRAVNTSVPGAEQVILLWFRL